MPRSASSATVHPSPGTGGDAALGAHGVVAFAIAVRLFVIFYKEPTLRKSSAKTAKRIAGTFIAGGLVR